MVKFHQLKNLAATDLALAQWYIFANFDTFTQTAKCNGNAFQQLESALLKTFKERIRPPTLIVFLLGDSLLDDSILNFNANNLYQVLFTMCKQLKRQVANYIEALPNKAKPLKPVRLFVTKPLPKPESFFGSRTDKLQQLAKKRHTYNNKLVSALQHLDISFINPGIQSSNSRAFSRIRDGSNKDKFKLTPEGLEQFWYSLSTSLQKLQLGLMGKGVSRKQDPHSANLNLR